MTLDLLEARITRNREQADGLNVTLNDIATKIRNNTSLSYGGMQAQIAKAYLSTVEKIAALAADERSAIEKKQTDLNRGVFGIYNTDPLSIIAFRDAQDRAGRLQSWQDASALLDSSALAGDSTLAAAIMARSLSEGWTEVITDYIASHPTQAEALSDLAEIHTFQNKAQNNFMNYLAYVTPLPGELSGLTPDQIDRAAQGARTFDGAAQ